MLPRRETSELLSTGSEQIVYIVLQPGGSVSILILLRKFFFNLERSLYVAAVSDVAKPYNYFNAECLIEGKRLLVFVTKICTAMKHAI